MSKRWLRLYEEVLDDPKVQRLSGEDFKGWVNLLCLASRGGGSLPCRDDIAFGLRMDAKRCFAMLDRLVSAGLLDAEGNGFTPHGWNGRQYKSDVSTERVKRFRKRGETVSETPPDTETDTEESSVDKSTAADAPSADPDKLFWDSAKSYLGKSKASKIGQWVRDHGRDNTAAAIAAAQVERAVDPIAFVEGRFRKLAGAGAGGWESPC